MRQIIISLLFIVGMMVTTQQVTAQTAVEKVSVEFTSEIADAVIYSVFELAEDIVTGQCPSDEVIESIMDEYEERFPDNCGEESPAVLVLQYAEGEFLCIQHDTEGDVISICMRTQENGWIENDPGQENILWKLSRLVECSNNLLE